MRSGLGLTSERSSNKFKLHRYNVGFNMPGCSSTAQLQQGVKVKTNGESNKNQPPLRHLVFISVTVCVCERGRLRCFRLQTGRRRRSQGLTMVPTLYVAAGPIVWW